MAAGSGNSGGGTKPGLTAAFSCATAGSAISGATAAVQRSVS